MHKYSSYSDVYDHAAFVTGSASINHVTLQLYISLYRLIDSRTSYTSPSLLVDDVGWSAIRGINFAAPVISLAPTEGINYGN